jgi:hypothetical protein
MNVIKELFPAKARRKVASTDWSIPSNVTVMLSECGPVTVCPIGLAIQICTGLSYEPTPHAAQDIIERYPEKFNKSVAGKLSDDYELDREVVNQFSVFMNQYDNRALTNADIAEAFGYPELAHS